MKKTFLSIISFLILLVSGPLSAQQKYPELGIVSGLAQDSIAYAAGFKLIGESVPKILSPALSDAEFQANLQKLKTAKCKVLSCNLFFPGSLKIAGPDVNEDKVLSYTETVLSRAKQAGVKYIVLGSSGARSIPSGYDMDKAKADFVILCKKLGQIAKKNDVIILLENLETTETNFITSLKSAAEIVKKVNEPNFRLNVDVFHMLREGESPDEIIAAAKQVGFCEIAEKEKRTLPGVAGDDFRPYLRALKKINYKGYIFIEASTNNASVEIPQAFQYLTKQIAEVYSGK
ncbi:sugar phosphate isomerase/epimerase family protein [Pedobacter miscanthi]|uniref:Sugar phosphate isomerase/epimerase n=1 Tax=Pedobacter miscanthi TaxID=2259170 RepID=A0A366KVC1_9SPHI|nr:sugar phosphate isomerase/epimerase family protein [Pedobacter miscanthi]RBQ05498.1 sugar phosphate isomerase/epimerase [Pedobacter miscanthi]